MGASLGTGDKKSVNVELNIVPFIDLMSCLTAFLLVTAVWVNIANLHPKVAGKTPVGIDNPNPEPKLSVLIEADDIWIGVSRVDEFQRIPNVGGTYDWTKFEATLHDQKVGALFNDKTDIEVAAASATEHPVAYQQLIHAMDIAVKVGFTDVGISDPNSLSARPTL
jgi:biopolymer transport protein ExbD